jgi:hypothetical protein
MGTWEYARFVATAPRLIDRSDDRDDIVVIAINAIVQDYKSSPASPWDVLNAMGKEGWELVTVVATVPPSPTSMRPTGVWEYVLKRPVGS